MPFSIRILSAPKPIEDIQGGPLVVNWNTLLSSDTTQGFSDSQTATGGTQSTQALTPILQAQALTIGSISLTTDGVAYTQNFDTLSNTAGSTTNNLTIPGWSMTESGGGARDNEQYAVDTGGSYTGATIRSLDISFMGEQWRLVTAGRTDQLLFQYSTDATDLTTGTWTTVSALNFTTPDTAPTGAKNGNAAAAQPALTSTLTGLNIPDGATIVI